MRTQEVRGVKETMQEEMHETAKVSYVAPCIEVIEVEHEGVIAASGSFSPGDISDGGGAYMRAPHSGGNTSLPLNDLEDLINDVLTFEK